MKALLVEDNPADARLIREMLKDSRAEKFQLLHVDRLGAAVERVTESKVKIVLLDLTLPDSHGIETLRRMQKAATGLPIVVLTGLDDETFALEAVRAGAQDYLVKGRFDSQLLIRTICYAIERHRAEEEIRRLNAQLEQRVVERTAELQANESILHSFFESPGVMRGIVDVVADDDVRHIRDNPVTAAYLGTTPEAMRGKLGSELGEPATVLRTWIRNYRQSEQTGKPACFEYMDQRGNQEVWLFATVSYLGTSPDGNSRFSYIVYDITERKQAEGALLQLNEDLEQRVAQRTSELAKAVEKVRAERQRFLDVLETLPVIVTLLRPDHRVEWVNRAYRAALGDNVGRLCFESQFGRDEPCLECQAFTPLKTRESHHWEWALPNGRTFDIHNFPFADADGSPMILEMDIDITEQRRAEAEVERHRQHLEELVRERTTELQRANEQLQAEVAERTRAEDIAESRLAQLRTTLDSLAEAVYVCDVEGKPVLANPAFERLTGCDISMLARDSKAIATQFPLFELDGTPARFEDRPSVAVLRGEIVTGRVFRLPGQPGGDKILRYNGAPVRDAQGNIIMSVLSIEDITASKLAEAALIRSEKLASVGRMAATIAHEINNPLAAVMNTVFLARENADSPEKVRQALDLADEELRRVAHLTRQTLGFYRESHAPVPMSINYVLDSSIDLLKSKIKAKQANIRKQYEAELEMIGVAGELRQVFSNIIGNSLDAIDDGGSLSVSVVPSLGPCGENSATIKICDNGCGIAPDGLRRLFEPFFTTKQLVGTGLGLWISKQIVTKHGGSISVESAIEGEHRGTTISIVLPLNGAAADLLKAAAGATR